MVEVSETYQRLFSSEKISMYPQLDNEMHFRLDEITKIKDYFIVEIRERG